jgi:flagellar hook protein FlgE
MSLMGSFAPAVSAMMAQSEKMEVIGLNIANLNTGGYKRVDTNFSTILAKTYGNNHDIGGVNAISRSMISQQGNILSSASNYDVAISGKGFFMLNSEIDGSGTKFYGRDGMFQQALGDEITATINGNTVTTYEGYLVDKNGYYVQGWPVNSDQKTFPTSEAALQSIRIDPEAFTNLAEATTTAAIGLNLPSDAATNYHESTFIKAYDSNGDLQSYQMRFTNLVLGAGTSTVTPTWNLPPGVATNYEETQPITVYDSEGYEQTVDLVWTKTANPNEWTLQAKEGSTFLDIDGTSDGTANPVTVTFDATDPLNATIISPTSLSIATQATNGSTFTLDMSTLTQSTGSATITKTTTTVDGTAAQQLDNNWTLEIFEADGTPIAIDSDATPNRLQLTFDGTAALTTPTSVSITDSTGNSFALDMTDITNYASGQIYEVSYDYNGNSDAVLSSFSMNSSGEIIGHFSDATQRPIYKLPLATFTNADALDPVNGNVYKYSPEAGPLVVRVAGGQGSGTFVPNAHEISNVNLEDEFSKMIVTQNAYNTASTVIRTVDEMTEVARDLKA